MIQTKNVRFVSKESVCCFASSHANVVSLSPLFFFFVFECFHLFLLFFFLFVLMFLFLVSSFFNLPSLFLFSYCFSSFSTVLLFPLHASLYPCFFLTFFHYYLCSSDFINPVFSSHLSPHYYLLWCQIYSQFFAHYS